MTSMSLLRRYSGPVGLSLALLWAAGCSRPNSVPAPGTTQANQAPFDADAAGNPRESATPPDRTGEGELHFQDGHSLPAGTLLTVRLKGAITAGTSLTGSSFAAIIDEPVVVQGNILIPRGAAAAGRIESTRISQVKPNRGYIRLALESIHVGEVDVPVQTASLFARQTADRDALIRLEKGRRLTFRLTEPVFLNSQRAQAVR
jgi:hypothetical protein